MGIFDKLFNRKQLSVKQSDQVVSLSKEISAHPSVGLTPQKLAQILEQAEQGYLRAQAELFMDMEEKDGHIQAEMHKRKMAVVGLDWSLQPPHDATATEKKAAARLERIIKNNMDVEDMIFDALDAIGHGYSCLELDWKKDKQGFYFPTPIHRTPRWFVVDPREPDRVRLRSKDSVYGDELQPFGWIEHKHKSHSGFLVRTGLHRALAWPYLFKNYAVKDLAELLDIYGLPIRIGKYNVGASPEEKKTLMKAIIGIGHNAGGIIPESMQMDFVAATSGSNADPFTTMIDWCEATESKAITGSVLSNMGAKGGSQALGNVHNEVRLDIRNSDARQLASSLTKQFIIPIAAINGLFADKRAPRWTFDTQEGADLNLYADALPKLAQAGAQIPVSYVNDKLKIPVPANGESVLLGTQQNNAGMAAGSARFTKDQQAIESLAEQMPVNSPIAAAAIESAIRAATSPQDLEYRLSVILRGADTSEFRRHLERALFAADVMGYAHAK